MSNDLSFLKVTIKDDEYRLGYKSIHQSMIVKKTITSITLVENKEYKDDDFDAHITIDFGKDAVIKYFYKHLHDAKELYKILCDALASNEKVSEVVFLGEHERKMER